MDSFHKPTRLARKKHLQEQAETQKAAWDKLTTMQKIEALDQLLGPNVGAKKQRTNLKRTLEEEHAIEEIKKEKQEKTNKKEIKNSKKKDKK